MTTIFGIKNCDTVKKARSWLEDKSVEYTFHDVRLDGLSLNEVQSWIDAVGIEELVNKQSTTWKQLSSQEQQQALTTSTAAMILANPTLFKRPVLKHDDKIIVGFKPDEYQSLFGL